jgi:hypothetical protein
MLVLASGSAIRLILANVTVGWQQLALRSSYEKGKCITGRASAMKVREKDREGEERARRGEGR